MLLEVIARARHRLLLNELAVQGAHSISVAMGMLVLVVSLGADMLDWPWLLIAPGTVFVAGSYFARRRRPGAYAAAQVVDSRLHLADTLSTAVFFGSAGRRHPDEGIREAQQRNAATVAGRVDLNRAIPLRAPRALYFSVMLAILAGGLMALRYYSEGRLDLRRPMAHEFGQLLRAAREELATISEALRRGVGDRGKSDTGAEPAVDSKDGGLSNAADAELATDKSATADGLEEEAAQRMSAGNSPQDAAANPGSDSSIFSKLSNAADNLFSILKPTAGRQGSQETSSGEGTMQNAAPRYARQTGNSADNKQPQAGQVSGSQDGDQRSDSQARAQIAGAPQNSNSDGEGQDGKGQDGSSAGANEGDKDIKTAEQLAAMGKISVILGKRSENVNGSAAVEVTSSGEQQLSTRYQQRRAQHVQVEAKTERDEVPPALREFVQQYFKQVRRAIPARVRK